MKFPAFPDTYCKSDRNLRRWEDMKRAAAEGGAIGALAVLCAREHRLWRAVEMDRAMKADRRDVIKAQNARMDAIGAVNGKKR